jgi:uncharacterized protein (DUF433 family)
MGTKSSELGRQTGSRRGHPSGMLRLAVAGVGQRPGKITEQPGPRRTAESGCGGGCDSLNHMRDETSSVQRSFRLSKRTVELLDAAAAAGRESRNALADRLLGEAVRLERHPLIRFHEGASGRHQPLVVGTRLYVHQVVSTVRASDGDIDEAAAYLAIAPRLVRAAIAYYAEFADEVDEDADVAARLERDERARWEREQRALA